MKIKFFLSIALIIGACTASQAQQPAAPRAVKRQVNQQQRIREGAQTGALTPREVQKLEAEQANIQATKAAAKADGKVTPIEKAVIEQKQDRANRHIRRQKHDRQHR